MKTAERALADIVKSLEDLIEIRKRVSKHHGGDFAYDRGTGMIEDCLALVKSKMRDIDKKT